MSLGEIKDNLSYTSEEHDIFNPEYSSEDEDPTPPCHFQSDVEQATSELIEGGWP